MIAADRWIGALRDSSRRLGQAIVGLPPDRPARPSLAGDWTIGQVLSHLGSGAEISTGLMERGLRGDMRGPVQEEPKRDETGISRLGLLEAQRTLNSQRRKLRFEERKDRSAELN